MPTIIIIDGIRIEIYTLDHPPPHFHARFGRMRAKFDIMTGNMIRGRMDNRSVRKVKQWTELNRDLLMQVWIASRPR